MGSFLEKINSIVATFDDIMKHLSEPSVTSDLQQFKELSKRKRAMDDVVEKIGEYKKLLSDIHDAQEIIRTGGDPEFVELAREELREKEAQLPGLETEIKYLLIPRDENEAKDTIMEIRAGTGGDEAALFAADLFRMYSRYAERKKWKLEIMSMSETEMRGFKEIIFAISGERVYSHLKYEAGVHRVQRVPETEAQGRVHTSAVSVVVLPEIEDTEITIDPKDLRIDVYRASGHGGQHVNKTESAVRITHLPTNIVTSCQDESSQIKNREKAMKVLRAKLFDYYEEQKNKSLAEERKLMIKTGDRSEKIRTYNYPQARVTDHRINMTLYKLDMFMDGDIEEMLNALIMDEKDRLLAAAEF